MKNKNILALLASVAVLSLPSCSRSTEGDIKKGIYEGHNLYYSSPDKEMNTFLNEFTRRNMRYDSEASGTFLVTNGTGFAKNWESMAVTFQNSSAEVYREDKIQKIANFLVSMDQDEQGLIYNTHNVFEPYFSETAKDDTGFGVPQGWPFPTWKNSVENVADLGMLEGCHNTAFEFNDGFDPQSENWKADNGYMWSPSKSDEPTGYASFHSDGTLNSGEYFRFYKDDLDALLPYSGGIDTRYAPMIDIDIQFNGANVSDYSVIWKIKGDDSWHRAPQILYSSTRDLDKNKGARVRRFFDMYLNEEWNNKIVTAIGIEFSGNPGSGFSVSDGIINYIRPSYDTRQSNATYQFLLALYNYYIYTRDIKTLAALMPKARRAMMFLTHALEGEKGLLNVGYLYGHDGVTPDSFGGTNGRLAYHGIGNGYFDLTVSPMYSLEANTYFYQSLKAMAVLENALKINDISPKEDIYVKNRIPGEEDVYYDFDAESLQKLAKNVKENMERPIRPVKTDFDLSYMAGDYHYQNEGGFYNPETGRFAIGINEATGEILDAGFLYWNLEAVCAGIGTDEQQLSIMKWVDGQRKVEGDKSVGDDIYFYEFAPRNNTADAEGCYSFVRDENFKEIFYSRGYDTWSRQVQNGGAIITWSYYDLVARSKVLGKENAWKRLEGIKKWYSKILKESTGHSYYFYTDYYDFIQTQAELDDPDMYMVYSVQNALQRGGGAIGLDAEFIEAVILIRAIPDALFGMDASSYEDLSFTYSLDSRDFFEIYNMKYGDAVYSIRQEQNCFEVFNISGIVKKERKITFRYKTENGSTPITVNGEKYLNARYEDGYLIADVDFGNVRVKFG